MNRFIRTSLLALGLALLFVALSLELADARPTTRALLRELGGAPCPNSQFTCVTLTVPLDHFNPADTRTIPVVFAVLPATGTRKGMFVTATGGPGTSGIYYADSYTAYFARSLTEHFDIVFFDQRGIGLSGGLTCPNAAARLYQADWRADTPKRERKLKAASRAFAKRCDAELGQPERLPFLGTAQAVEDLEAFRVVMQDDRFWLYGESYGTQYAQTYAHAHPDHLAGMILDGTVDLTPDGIAYYAQAVQAFNDTLVASFAACAAQAPCASDFGRDPLRVYDELAAKLARGEQKSDFPTGYGKRITRPFGFDDLETVGTGAMYGQYGRMLFTRALAAYARDGDLVPLLRLLYPNLGVDENTLEPIPDPSWSDALYYGVECQDYGYYVGTSAQRADAFVAAAKPVEQSGLRLSGLIWGDLPCVYWRDSSQDMTRPPHWSAPGIPTLVLNALADPITPMSSARAVFDHLDDGYMITQRGGPHVIFGRGVKCIDRLVTAFLVNDQVPVQRETECPGQVMTKYVPLAPVDSRDFASPLGALQSAETEINYLPEYWYWDYVTPTRTGCAQHGVLQFEPVRDQIKFTFERCAFSKGFEMSGIGYYDLGSDRFWAQVSVTGLQRCELNYERVGSKTTLTGNCAGSRVNAGGAAEPYTPPRILERRPTHRFQRAPLAPFAR